MLKNVILDIDNKVIKLKSLDGNKKYDAKKLYSVLMDMFDEPEYMRYDLPIEAISKSEFKLINGWTIDEKTRKYLKGKLL